MRNLFFLIGFLVLSCSIFSCEKRKIEKVEMLNCVVSSCEKIERNSIHDEINPPRYRLKTSCNILLISYEIYEVGDTLQIEVHKYKQD